MGWTWSHRDKGQCNRAYFEAEFTSIEVIADKTIDLVWYAAGRKRDNPHDVFALVFPIGWRRGYYNFGYKDQDETCGPGDVKCPVEILDLLTPTDSEYANRWRADCRAYAAEQAAKPKVRAGNKIRFAQPISFTNGAEHQEFMYEKRNDFIAAGRRYRIPGWRDRAYEVVEAAA